MDADHFDQIAAHASGSRGRRRVVAGLSGSALVAAGLIPWQPREEAAAGEGANGGKLGGRHDKNRRGENRRKRNRRRDPGDKKAQAKEFRRDYSDGFDPARPLRDCSQVKLEPNADLSSCDLTNRNLSYANLRSANLHYANLAGANATSIDIFAADLLGANLVGANLTGTKYCSTRMPNGKERNDCK